LVVLTLGITWILHGLEVTLVSAIGGIVKQPATLGLTDAQIGAGATAYLIGQVVGALVFGFATDQIGRKKLFIRLPSAPRKAIETLGHICFNVYSSTHSIIFFGYLLVQTRQMFQ
jgi:MFS family permease